MNLATTTLGARQRQKADTRATLMQAARTVLARRGLANTTTREVAEEAHVAAGTFFVHFKDLNALIEVLLDEHIATTLESAYRTVTRKSGVIARLLHVSGKLLESYEREPELSRAYLSASLFQSTPGGTLTARLEGFRAWVFEQLDEAIARAELPALDRQLAFVGFFSLYFGALIAGLSGWMSRKQQLAHLEAALVRLLLLEGTKGARP